MFRQFSFHGRQADVPELKPFPFERSRETFPGNMVPQAFGFLVTHDGKPVDHPGHAKPVQLAVNDGRQTDASIARRSIGNQVGFALQFTLGEVMVNRL